MSGRAQSWSEGLAHDISYAGRLFRRQAGFTMLVVCTMAVGIGVSTTLFSVTYGVLMKPLPWQDSQRLVLLSERRGGNLPRFNAFSNAAYLAWRAQKTTIDDIAAWSPRTMLLGGAGDPERIRLTAATASLFAVLGTHPLIGSLFEEKDESPDTGRVVVLSERLWRQRFGAQPDVLGRVVQLDGQPHVVVGVLPDGQAYPDREARAWIPFHVAPTTGQSLSMINAVARLRPGATAAQASAEASARARTAPRTADLDMTVRAIFGGNGPIEIFAVPLRDALTAEVRRPLLLMLAAVGLLFITATSNVAGLLLARATQRRREMAIRAALGAGTSRVRRQLLIESALLGLGGCAAGLLLAVLLHGVLPSTLPSDFPRLADVRLDAMAVAFAVIVSMMASIAFGLLPAVRLRRLNVTAALAEGGTAPSGSAGGSRTARTRMAIMVGQVAIAAVLLIGASLLGRTFLALVNADRGFDPSNVLTARLQLPAYAYTPERRRDIVGALVERLRGVPGVAAAAYSDGPPLGVYGGTAFWVGSRQVQAASRTVVPDYFAAMGLRFVGGRAFTDEDIATNQAVFIVNRTFARQYLGDHPVGERVRGWVREGRPDWQIVGVVEDVRHRGVMAPLEPEVYRYRRMDDKTMPTSPIVIVRTDGDAAALVPTVRAMARQQDPSLVVDAVTTMEDQVMTSLARPRLYAILLGGFAVCALLIAGTGLFGVLSYAVALRSRELALRAAVGATPADLIRLVAGQGLAVTSAGLALGLAGSIVLARAIATLLYGVTQHDAVTYVAVPVILLAVAAAACIVPARHAARVDPARALKAH